MMIFAWCLLISPWKRENYVVKDGWWSLNKGEFIGIFGTPKRQTHPNGSDPWRLFGNDKALYGTVAIPSIAMTFDTTGTQQNWITDGFTLAMAATVLYFGAIGDRHGRKKLFLVGAILSVPTAFLSAIAWSAEILIIGRILSGFASALLFPTTLSLITAIWPAGPGRTKSIALWAGIGGAASALGPTVGGFLVQTLSWRWIFGISIHVALISFLLG